MSGHTGNGTCIRSVDESEFKVSVLGQGRLEKNRSQGLVLEPNCTLYYSWRKIESRD